MKRKVIKWKEFQPPVQYFPTLECGHDIGDYEFEGDYSQEQKELIEHKDDNQIECSTCAEIERTASALEKQAKELRSKIKITKLVASEKKD